MKNTQTLMNKSVYLRLPILKSSKILMYEFWYDHVTTKNMVKNKIMLYRHRQLRCFSKSK